jgi:hypothetical protein
MRWVARTRKLLATLGFGVLTLVPAGASADAPNPPENIPLGALPPECAQAPRDGTCENAIIQELDGARAITGLGPYLLPGDFTALAPDRQLLILTDLDRLAYGLTPVPGLDAELDSSTAEGVDGDFDPLPPAELSPGGAVESYAANWAGGFSNVLEAYYEWMYDDGYPSANRDCTSPGASGCWGHRLNVIGSFPAQSEGSLSLGASAGVDTGGQPSYTLLITLTPQAGSYYYSWAEAQAEGAGREEAQFGSPGDQPEIAATTLGVPTDGSLLSADCATQCPGTLDSEATSGSPAGAHSAQLAASLAGQLVPSPHAAKLPVLLRTGACPLNFKSPSAGVVSIRWYGARRSSDAAAASGARPLLLAAGRMRFASPSTRTVEVQLTALGRRTLRHGAPLRLTAVGTFTRAGARSVSARRSFSLAH